MPFPTPGDLPSPSIEHASLASPALAGGFFTTSATWDAQFSCVTFMYIHILIEELYVWIDFPEILS